MFGERREATIGGNPTFLAPPKGVNAAQFLRRLAAAQGSWPPRPSGKKAGRPNMGAAPTFRCGTLGAPRVEEVAAWGRGLVGLGAETPGIEVGLFGRRPEFRPG